MPCSIRGSSPQAWWAVSLGVLLPGILSAAPFDVVISEIHYHPPLESGAEERLEFVELRNLGDESVDVSGWSLAGGVDFVFPEGAVIDPFGYLVAARDQVHVGAVFGITNVVGDFAGKLANDRESISLRNARGILVDRAAWRDTDGWPENPDGLGPSLEKKTPTANGEEQASWRASILPGGTPGEQNSTEENRQSNVLIAPGDTWKYRKGTSEPSNPLTAWTQLAFVDSTWSSGASGFGYGDNDDTTVLSDMRNTYTTVYLRKRFTLADPAAIESLLLTITYDDAYVVYLNGVEVGRSSSAGGTAGTALAAIATAQSTHENTDGDDTIDLAAFRASLRAGDNLLAIQGLNEAIDSSDFSLIPTLTAVELAGGSLVEPAHDVEINEVVAGADGFIELYNEATTSTDLTGWRLTESPVGEGGFAFPGGTVLAPGAWVAVPASSLPFGLSSLGQWIGLVTADGRFVDGLETRGRPAGRPFGRFPDGDGDTFVLDGSTPGAANTLTLDTSLVINEIVYHPPLAADGAELIELHNRGTQPLNLLGWRLDQAVKLTFPSVTIPPGGFVVAAGNPAQVASRYGLTGVLGPWTGKLANSSDKIELKDPLGNRVSVAHYADDGTWPRSTTTAGPDGFGPSIELVHPGMEANHGSAWLASTGIGTPGAQNSRFTADPAPVIRGVAHTPLMPRSTDAVVVTARISDERAVASARVFSRVDGSGAFASVVLLDDGAHDDGAAGDGRYGASLAKRASGTIVQFYVEATDDTGHTRRYPAGAPTEVCLYQVDDRAHPAGLPLYRAILKGADLATLESRPLDSDVPLPGTFLQGKSAFYQVGLRYRGDNSRAFPVKAFRIDLTHDEPFEGITRLNLNAEDIHLADCAADFLRRADVPVFNARPVNYTLNNAWQNKHGGTYLRVEAIDNEFLARVFQGDDAGNLYRGIDPTGAGEADLRYLGPDAASYEPFYLKRTNEDLQDYSDIIALTDAFTNASEAEFPALMESLLDVDEWLRYFAAETALNNQDGAIATDTGEDYYIYRRASDAKWVLIPWDQNENFQTPAAGIYRMGIAAVRRLALHPLFVGRYQQALLDLVNGAFGEDAMFRQIGSRNEVYGVKTLEPVVDFVPARAQTIQSLLPERLSAGVEPVYFARSGDDWRFFRGTREPSNGTTAWTGVNFNDSTWELGPGGFGYGDGDDRTTLSDMEGNYTTVYLRRAFDLSSPASVSSLKLSIRFDDGFVAYLNGTEISRQDATGAVAFTSVASADHEAGAPLVVDVSAFRSSLRAGKNVLALVGLNSAANSSDLTLDPELLADPAGTGCGTELLAEGSLLAVGGLAPIPATHSVLVNGAPAALDLLTGHWNIDVDLAGGSDSLVVQALDLHGFELDSVTVSVQSGASLTSVSGNLATTRWTAANSPYHVTGTVTVAAGATLTIDPGVDVYFDGGAALVVRGVLSALGTEASPISFRSSTCTGAWGGLVLPAATSRGTLRYVRLEGASTATVGSTSYPAAVTLEAGATLDLDHSTIADLQGPAIDAAGGSKLTVVDSLIEEALEAVHATSSYVLLERTTIRRIVGKSDCIDFDGDSNPRSIIRNCLLEDGSDDGVDLGGANPLVELNVIRRMACKGLSIEGASSPTFRGNLVQQCNDGLVSKDGATPALSHNTVVGCNIGIHFYEKNPGAGGGRGTADSLIVWGNGRSVLLDPLSSITMTQSDVEGGYPGAGNLNQDPMFVAPLVGDFHLLPGSPAIGTGAQGTDMGAYGVGTAPPATFVRGDANGDLVVDIADPVTTLLFLFAGRSSVPCEDALDTNDDGQIVLTDAVRVLEFLFRGGAAPAAPFPARGADPTSDTISCGG